MFEEMFIDFRGVYLCKLYFLSVRIQLSIYLCRIMKFLSKEANKQE